MKLFFRRLFLSCVSFKGYEEIAFQPMRRSLLYFVGLMLLSSVLLFPKYFDNQKQMIFPVLDALAKDFPTLEFKNHELVTVAAKEPEIITSPLFGVVVDPAQAFRQTFLFPGFWLWFKKQAVQFNYQSDLGQWFSYNNPLVAALFQELAGFQGGNGSLDGSFFMKLKTVIESTAVSNGVFFMAYYSLLGMIASFFLALLGQAYSQFIGTTLPWKSVRNLSYYSLTPVVLFLVSCYHLNLNLTLLQPLLFVMYLLFLLGAIRRFKKPEEESKDDGFFL